MANSNLAYRSSISIKSISNSVSGLREGISNTQRTVINISSVLSNSNKQKRDQISRSEGLFRKRREAVKRREQEDVIEASSIGGAIKRTGKVVTNSTKGFLGRIFDAVGVLMIGWLVNNLPMIIDLAGKLSKRVKKLFGILSTGVSGISDILLGFGGVLSGLYSNIISFDFTDSQGKIGKSFDRITDGFDRVERSIRQTIRLLAGDLNRLFGFDTKVDEFALPSDEDITPGSGGRVSGGSSDFWTLVAVVSREDRDDAQGQADVAQSIYNRAASGAYGTSNIRELILRPTQYQPTWDYPKKGKDGTPNPEWYQIRDAESAAKASGLSVGTIRSVAANLLNKTLQKKAAEFVQGRTDFKGFEVPGSIQRKAGDNYFGWEYNYRGTGIAPVPQLGAKLLTLPELKNIKLKKGDILTDVIGRGVEYIEITDVVGSSREGGRKHAGIDIGAPAGTYISLRVDCEVVGFKSAQSGGKYGNVIDVWIPSYGVQLRFAHCKNLLITSGKIKAETSFATVGETGSARGPHIHLEYTKQRGRMSGSDGDPSPYVELLLLTNGKLQASATTTTNKTTTVAQINIEDVRRRDPQALAKNKPSNIITVPAPQQPQQIASAPIMSDSGPSFTPSGDNVNTFITKKLLLDLAYT